MQARHEHRAHGCAKRRTVAHRNAPVDDGMAITPRRRASGRSPDLQGRVTATRCPPPSQAMPSGVWRTTPAYRCGGSAGFSPASRAPVAGHSVGDRGAWGNEWWGLGISKWSAKHAKFAKECPYLDLLSLRPWRPLRTSALASKLLLLLFRVPGPGSRLHWRPLRTNDFTLYPWSRVPRFNP